MRRSSALVGEGVRERLLLELQVGSYSPLRYSPISIRLHIWSLEASYRFKNKPIAAVWYEGYGAPFYRPLNQGYETQVTDSARRCNESV